MNDWAVYIFPPDGEPYIDKRLTDKEVQDIKQRVADLAKTHYG